MPGITDSFSGSGSYDLSSSSGVGGGDSFGSSGPSFGDTVIGSGGGLSVSSPVLIGAAVVALAGFYFWSKR